MRGSFPGMTIVCVLAAGAARAALAPASPAGEEVYRLNCGAETWEYTDPQGNQWVRDESFEPLYRWGHVNGTPAESLAEISNTDLDPVYRTHRWGGTDMRFRIEVPTGTYTVTLHFAETYWNAAGQRRFDVDVEGQRALSNLDVYAAAGGKNKPYAFTVSRTVTDGALDVTFPNVYVDNALISGIEVRATAVSDADFSLFLAKKMFWYFWNEADPQTGLVADVANSFAPGGPPKASIAATGFGLSAITIAAQRGWITPSMARERVRNTLNFFDTQAETFHGFWYHFMDRRTGARWADPAKPWEKTEVSTVDSALFIMGALQAGEYFRATAPEITAQADRLYRRMEWDYFTGRGNGDTRRDKFLSMGWTPEDGFIHAWWESYSESLFVDLLAFSSPDHAVSTAAWTALGRDWQERQGYSYIHYPSLFVHQYHQLYYDLRNQHDDFADYAQNTVWATQVNRLTCLADPRYDVNRWGVSAAYGADGNYYIYGTDNLDGTVAPTAAGGSFNFTPQESLAALRHMYFQYKRWNWGRNGFTDSFNVSAEGAAPYTLGLDNGPILIAIENQLSGLVRDGFMANPHVRRGMDAVGLRPYTEPYAYASNVWNDNPARYAVDGSTATRWESAWSDPQFLAMDFITPQTVNKVTLLWETAHAKSYGIQYSNDGTHWTEVYTTTAADGGQDIAVFPAVTARRFRVFGRERGGVDGNVWGYSLWDCRFENDPSLVPPPPSGLTAAARTVNTLQWTWTDNASQESGYRLDGATAAAGPFTKIADLPANATAFTETGLYPGTTYYRRVAAVSAAGETFSPTASAMTAGVFTAHGPTAADGTLRAVFDATGTLHVTFYDPSLQGLRYTRWNGTAWVGNELIDPNAAGYPADDGTHVFLLAQDLAVDPLGRPQVVYYTAEGKLRHAVKTGGAWVKEDVASVGPGVVPSLAVDPAGRPRVLYVLADGDGSVVYARKTVAGWVFETLPGANANTAHLALDPAGWPQVVYGLRSDPHALYHTRLSTAGWSAPEQVDALETWRYRVNPTLLLDGAGQPRVLDCLNNRDGRVRYSLRGSTGWMAEYAHVETPDWDHTGTPDPGFALDGSGRPHALYVMHDSYAPFHTKMTYAVRTSTGWTETLLGQSNRWGVGAALALDAQGRDHLISLATDGRLRLIRYGSSSVPVGGGRNSLAQAPTGLAPVVSSGAVTWTWVDRAKNETGYRIYGSTVADGPHKLITTLAANTTSYVETALPAGTTVYRYVVARNAAGSAWSGLASLRLTVPSAPTHLAVAARTPTSLRWTWMDNAASETGFRVRRASDNVVLADALPANTTTWTQTGLGVNTPQRITVEAYSQQGSSTSAPSGTFYSLAQPPAGTALSQVNGLLALSWTANGNPAGTVYRAYQSTNNVVYTQFYSSTGLGTFPTGLLPGATYYFRARAQNGNGLPTAFDLTVSTRTPVNPASPSLAGVSGPPGTDLTGPAFRVAFAGPTSGETVILQEPVEDLPPPPAPARLLGRAWRLSLDGPEAVPLTLSPRGPRSGTPVRWDDGNARWVPLAPPGRVDGPGVFALLFAPTATPDTARVYPNPFRPARGHTAVTVTDIPVGTRVRLYTPAGELVRELAPADAFGSTSWDGRNGAGRAVAGGVYLGVANKDGDTTTFRVAVEQ